jgi:hypothetical protein
MAKKAEHMTPGTVVLNGYQSVFKETPKGGFCLAVDIEDPDFIAELESRRAVLLAETLASDKIKSKKRATVKPAPWVEDEESDTLWNLKFNWKKGFEPSIIDSNGTVVDATKARLFSGAVVRVAFNQRGFILVDGETYGTCCDIKGIQVIKDSGSSPGGMSADDAKDIFGAFEGGFAVGDIPDAASDEEADAAATADF